MCYFKQKEWRLSHSYYNINTALLNMLKCWVCCWAETLNVVIFSWRWREPGSWHHSHLSGRPALVAMVTLEEEVNREFQVSDIITASSTGSLTVKPETEHVFHTLLRLRQERLHCAEGNAEISQTASWESGSKLNLWEISSQCSFPVI